MIEIREMSMADYDEVMALWEGMEGIGLSESDSREAIARYLARNPGMSFVARQVNDDDAVNGSRGELVGAVLCGHDGRRGYLHHLAVRPDTRQQGLGRQLVDRCMACLQREGIDKCHLFVKRTNELGQAFWEQVGWTERKSLVIMSRDL